jgi:Rod binding domain-containing protein
MDRQTSSVLPAVAAHAAPARHAGSITGKPAKIHTEFEAAMLSVMLEAALPKGKATFGKGLSGEMARSALARQLGSAMAERGTFGIAKHIANAKRP